MKRTKINNISLILMMILIITLIPKDNSNSKDVTADPFVSSYSSYSGIFFGPENHSLVLENADVVYDILYLIDEKHIVSYDFQGTFLISNSNETISVTMGIPNPDLDSLELHINGNTTDFDVLSQDDIENNSPWFEILKEAFHLYDIYDFQMLGIYSLLMFNVTFGSYSNTTIEYSFSYHQNRGPFVSPSGDCESYYYLQSLHISYFIGTAKLWNHNITESITMSVTGKQPDHFTHSSYKACQVTTEDQTTSYMWSWDNEAVNQIGVGIDYHFVGLGCNAIDIYWLSFPLGLLFIIYIIRKKQRRRN